MAVQPTPIGYNLRYVEGKQLMMQGALSGWASAIRAVAWAENW
jgi:hypothetical protein